MYNKTRLDRHVAMMCIRKSRIAYIANWHYKRLSMNDDNNRNLPGRFAVCGANGGKPAVRAGKGRCRDAAVAGMSMGNTGESIT